LDSNGLLERDGARTLLNADGGWPELQIQRGRRTDLPSSTGRSVTVAAVGAVTQEAGDIVIMLGVGDHSCQRWKLSPSLADKIEFELATARMRR
jgi:hypothetical protein